MVYHQGTTDSPFGYVGNEGYYADPDTGLLKLGARYYDPTIGRFITLDPGRDGLNWYVYAGGNPVNAIDPTGNETYVFYYNRSVNGFAEQAKNSAYFDSKSKDVTMISVLSAKDFVREWNRMDSSDIDNVYMYLHGGEGSLFFYGKGNTLTFDGELSFDDLFYKPVENMVYLFSCSGGAGEEGENIAWMFADKTGARVRACTGGVSFFNLFRKDYEAVVGKDYFFTSGWRTYYYEPKYLGLWGDEVARSSSYGKWAQ